MPLGTTGKGVGQERGWECVDCFGLTVCSQVLMSNSRMYSVCVCVSGEDKRPAS